MARRRGLAPNAWLPGFLAYLVFSFANDVPRWLRIEERATFWWIYGGMVAAAVVLVGIAVRIHRRWLREQGIHPTGVQQMLPPELWIGIGVLTAGVGIPPLLGASPVVKGVFVGLSLMAAVALVVLAAVRAPERKATDEARHRAGWTDPFA